MKQTAYVRYKPDADNLTISLVLGGRQRNLNRPVDEPLEKPITRIRANCAPAKQDKRAKKKKPNPPLPGQAAAAAEQEQQEQELFVGLFRDAAGTELIDASTPNGQAWPQAALLKVGAQVFVVLLNPPTVETLSLPNFPMAGYPLLPVVGLAFAEAGLSRWRWLRKTLNPSAAAAGSSGSSKAGSKAAAAAAGEWEETGCYSICYTPTEQDIGCMLKVECTPAAHNTAAAAGNSGNPQQQQQGLGASLPSSLPIAAAAAAAQQGLSLNPTLNPSPAAAVVYGEPLTADTGPVRAAPEQPAARLRQLSPGVPLLEPWRFRVMSYNILADQYAGTSYAQKVLFKYCPTELLDNNYRRQLVLEEVLRYQPDICCLQEVDDKVFAEYLAPHLDMAGFSGHYTNKQGRVREGSAMFWRRDKWSAAAVADVKLRDVFRPPLSERHSQFRPMLDASPALEEALQKVTTIAQMVLLLPRHAAAAAAAATDPSSSSGGDGVAAGAPAPLLVINTHLFFHPYAPHIRSLHTAAILEEAAAALAVWQQQSLDQQGLAAAAVAEAEGLGAVESGLLGALVRLPPPTLLFCGDLNSDLNSGVPGVVEMLQTGRLAADHWDWQMGASFRWGKEEGEYAEEEQQQQQAQPDSQAQQQQQQAQPDSQAQQQQQQAQPDSQAQQPGPQAQQQPGPQAQQQPGPQALPAADGHDFDPPSSSPRASLPLVGMDVAVPFVLRSADDLATPYTNYTSGYKALLDYVWYDPTRLHVTKQLPVPAEQLLASFIPSPNFPSDHLAVVYDLAFKPQGLGEQQGLGGQQQQQQGGLEGVKQHDSATFTLLPASEDHVGDAVAALRRGEVVALPTDTLYGLAAAASSTAAVQQLRRIKQRSPHVPLAVAVADVADVATYCLTDHLPEGLLRALLPGPVTVLLPLKPGADLAEGLLTPLHPGSSSSSSAGGSSSDPTAAAAAAAAGSAVVGVRVVPNEFVRGVCRGLGQGIALTSANLSGTESSLCVQDFRELWQFCGAVFDSGRVPVSSNLGSTVLDLTRVQPAAAVAAVAGQQQQLGGASAAGGFRIVRAGVAADSVVELITKAFGLRQLP